MEHTGDSEEVESKCTNLVDSEPIFTWIQVYTPFIHIVGVMRDCFIVIFQTVDQIIQLMKQFDGFAREYILPLNISVLNVTTTTAQTTTTTSYTISIKTTSATTKSTTTSSYASHLFGHMNNVILCFAIIFLLH